MTAGRRRNGTIDQCWQLLSRVQDQKPSISIVPHGTDIAFCFISQHFVLGYFHWIPPRPALRVLATLKMTRMRPAGYGGTKPTNFNRLFLLPPLSQCTRCAL